MSIQSVVGGGGGKFIGSVNSITWGGGVIFTVSSGRKRMPP